MVLTRRGTDTLTPARTPLKTRQRRRPHTPQNVFQQGRSRISEPGRGNRKKVEAKPASVEEEGPSCAVDEPQGDKSNEEDLGDLSEVESVDVVQKLRFSHDIGSDNNKEQGGCQSRNIKGPESKTVAGKREVSSEVDDETEEEIESEGQEHDETDEEKEDDQDEDGSESEVELKKVESDGESEDKLEENEESDDESEEEESDDANENSAALEEEPSDDENEGDLKGEDESNDESEKDLEEESEEANRNIAALFAKTLASRLHSANSRHADGTPTAEEEVATEALERDLSVGASFSELGVQVSTLLTKDTSGIVRSSVVNAGCAVPGSLKNLHLSETAPPVNAAKEAQRLKRRMKAQAPATAGDGWFGMGAPELTFEVKNDLRMIRNRAYIDPKRHYKKDNWKAWPKFFEMGTVIEGKQEFYSSRMSRRERKQTLAEEILADDSTRHYMKRKYKEISALKPSKKKLKHTKKY